MRLPGHRARMGAPLDVVNTFFHIPVLNDYMMYCFWFTMMLLSPFVGMGIFLHDHLSGHIWT